MINLKKECSSSNPQVAALSGAMLRLQNSVIQQFHLYRLSSGKLSPVQEEPIKCIDPWVLRGSGNQYDGRPPETGQPELRQRGGERPLKRRSSIAVTGSYPKLRDGAIVGVSRDLNERVKCPKRKRPLSLPKISPILEAPLNHVRQKIIKAKWSKDLHEFSSDQMLPTAEFEAIREDLDYRRAELGTKCIKYLACAAERPCWAIVRSLALIVFLIVPPSHFIDGV